MRNNRKEKGRAFVKEAYADLLLNSSHMRFISLLTSSNEKPVCISIYVFVHSGEEPSNFLRASLACWATLGDACFLIYCNSRITLACANTDIAFSVVFSASSVNGPRPSTKTHEDRCAASYGFRFNLDLHSGIIITCAEHTHFSYISDSGVPAVLSLK